MINLMNEMIGATVLLIVGGIIAAIVVKSALPAVGLLAAVCFSAYALAQQK